MNMDIEYHIRTNCAWPKLPANVKQSIGNVQREYEKLVVQFSIKNQLRYKGNLVKTILKDERKYYEDLLKYSREHLMLYPYHLSDVIVKGLRVTPFSYYITIMADIMTQEKSYDSLPNFTAADCLRLMAIGRNQYIDIMNQCRSSKKFFRRRPVKELLPAQPVDAVVVEPWWIVQTGYIVDEDIKMCSLGEKKAIDQIIDHGPSPAGDLDFTILHGLYRKGLVYMDVPIADSDYIVVPPLEGFVMNRVLGDYFETLLYKIFVSIDERTTIAELATVLEIDLQLVKNAVSVFCRLGFAKKKLSPGDMNGTEGYHESWRNIEQQNILTKKPTQDQLLIDWTASINELPSPFQATSPDSVSLVDISEPSILLNTGHCKRIAFLFDSTLTAFLMMGNLSPGLKSHAVTMFEVGKLNDECLDSFLAELEKVDAIAEGEAQRYFDHAITLRDTIRFLRHNRDLISDPDPAGAFNSAGHGVDLLRCESLLGLDPATCTRVLNKNYTLLVSVAPLSNEIRPVSSSTPPHLGPAIPEVNSIWFKLYIYHLTGSGPPSLLLVKGTRLRCLPRVFRDYDRLLVTTWGHDPAIISTANILLTLNDALSHSALLVQGHGFCQHEGQVVHVPFPFLQNDDSESSIEDEKIIKRLSRHSAVGDLDAAIDLRHTCGYVTMLRTGSRHCRVATCNGSSHVYRGQPGGNDVFDKLSLGEISLESGGDTGSLTSPIDTTTAFVPVVEKSTTCDSLSSATVNGVSSEAVRNEDDADGEDDLWVLLDCYFGVPLFDAIVNQSICRRISKHGLCNQRSLQELVSSNRKLAADLLAFVSHNQSASPISSGLDESTDGSTSSVAPSVPLPMQNLLFSFGSLSVWDGH